MLATIIFAAQAALSLVSFGLLARWVIYPRLKRLPLAEALTPLLLFETFRTVGLLFLTPGVTDAALPTAFAIPEAAGDLIAVALAFVALVALRLRWRGALALVWLFTIEGMADFANAIALGLRFNIANYHLGLTWLIPTYGVPVFLIVQLLIIALLLLRRTRQASPQRTAGAESFVEPLIANGVKSAI